eukprot:5285200-Pleurochrysis_carterae.AAC.1
MSLGAGAPPPLSFSSAAALRTRSFCLQTRSFCQAPKPSHRADASPCFVSQARKPPNHFGAPPRSAC